MFFKEYLLEIFCYPTVLWLYFWIWGILIENCKCNKIIILHPLTFKVYQIQELKFDVILKWLLVSKMEDSNPFLGLKRSNVECLLSEAATRGVLWKKVFLEISQNSQENTCARVSFLKTLQVLVCNFTKTETLAQVFSCESAKFPRAPVIIEYFWWLLLFYARMNKQISKQLSKAGIFFFIYLIHYLQSISL